MPELPEVETVRRQLSAVIDGRVVLDVRVPDAHRHLVDLDRAVGRRLGAARRRGKVIVCDLYAPPGRDAAGDVATLELVVHLGMSGRLVVAGGERPSHVRAELDLDDGAGLWFVDPRRFGRLMVCVPGRYPTLPMLAHIGPELFTLTGVALHRALSVSDRSVKALLLDQRLVAGVGNIYADEALWLAGVHPARAGRSLSPTEVEVLLARLVEVCEASIAAGGTTFRDYRDVSGTSGGFAARLSVYGRAGQPCRRCGLPLVSGRVAGRGTVWCRSCQPEEGAGSGTDTVSDPLRTTEVAR